MPINNELIELGKKLYEINKERSDINDDYKETSERIKELMRSMPREQWVIDTSKTNKVIHKFVVESGIVLNRTINPPEVVLSKKGKEKAKELIIETYAGTEEIDEYFNNKEESDTLRLGKK